MQAEKLQYDQEQKEHAGKAGNEQVLPVLPQTYRAQRDEVASPIAASAVRCTARRNSKGCVLMSEEKIEQSKPKAPAKKKVKGSNRIAKWFREMRSELKKVVWPTPKQIMNNTLISLSVMVAAAITIWAIDWAGGQIFQAIRTLAGR